MSGEIAPVPAGLRSFMATSAGPMVPVDDDVLGVARDLRALSSSLCLRYSEAGGYFVVYQREPGPAGRVTEHLVTTAVECDQRLVTRVRKVMHPDYDLAGELTSGAAERKAARDHNRREQLGEFGERAAHALRRDLGATNRIFVP